MAGPTVLHWGVAKSSAGEWLVRFSCIFIYFLNHNLLNKTHFCNSIQTPPPDVLPEKSKIVHGACQTYFTDMSSREHSYQVKAYAILS